ncbi:MULTISPECIES: lasso peptide biosynthesis PqqD family chaperone [Actinopolyspora]|uniref:Coenzyme PQQ synthesis protein D (PqqD) n=1 Tax=Actinopolyspora saharensis TaxID=995062 RepID=A0A1H0Z1J8_9ACTN|nr:MULTISPECIES: lasso peptide biosynthesis PqqD family chaperone [Actinopolyspora]NHD16102.1 lasso peptide biosynthesis PqqD family chaperone [Actinopolyspora sp. BKK2]NHE74684.1 lasso peptide biosynthesis PqqD family chaperone [Actinopolyspora sp. BKK1]SDQ21254.1 Coenzyme PQQ synthesis protein D (PqqD) [Actinopolyspora saharensis]
MVELAARVILTETEHGTVLLDEHTGRYWMTNATGRTVLRSFAAGGTVLDAAAALCAAHTGVTMDDAERDAAALLEQLRRSGLVLP